MNIPKHVQADDCLAIYENRMLLYSKPYRYFNRERRKGPALKYLFLVYAILFILIAAAGTAWAQQRGDAGKMLLADNDPVYAAGSIQNYTTVYNSGKVFLNWTAKNEPADCIYIIERSQDGKDFSSVGIKEGIGTEIELFYSWMDDTPPDGFAYYRVKKITRDGMQFYSAANPVINMGSSYNPKVNYAQGTKTNTPGQGR
jgi:hypothetical protein